MIPSASLWAKVTIGEVLPRLRVAGDVVRDDVMNALRVLSDKGLAGLKKAVTEGAVLPSIAILGALGLRHLAPVDATDEAQPDGLLR